MANRRADVHATPGVSDEALGRCASNTVFVVDSRELFHFISLQPQTVRTKHPGRNLAYCTMCFPRPPYPPPAPTGGLACGVKLAAKVLQSSCTV